jgi:hypothetical protein
MIEGATVAKMEAYTWAQEHRLSLRKTINSASSRG